VELLTAYVDGSHQEVRVVLAFTRLPLKCRPGTHRRLGTVGRAIFERQRIATTRIQYQEMIQAVRTPRSLLERIKVPRTA
jgi:hypothetical protein